MTFLERRFGAGMTLVLDDNAPGLVQDPAGYVYLVKPDGSRCLLDCGGGGGNTPDPAAPGDMLYSADGLTWTVLSVGANGEVLTVVAGEPDWAAAGTAFTPGDALDLTGGGILNVLYDGVTIDLNGSNQLEAIGAPPTGAAGGALAGTYPNPDLNSALAGAGLGFLANVLHVNVDGTTIQVNGSNQLEVISSGVLTGAVIKAPGSSVRNTITSTGDFIELPISGASGQTVDLLNAGIFGASSPFFRVVPGQAVGIGAGTYDPAAYGTNVISRLVLSASQATVATGGPAIDPGSSSLVQQLVVDTNVAYSATNSGAQRSMLVQMIATGSQGTSSFGAYAAEFSNTFSGTKASGTVQAVRSYGIVSSSLYASGATGDLTRQRAITLSADQAGGTSGGTVDQMHMVEANLNVQKGNIGTEAVGLNLIAQCSTAHDAAATTIPLLIAARVSANAGARTYTSVYGIHILPIEAANGGTDTITNARSLYLQFRPSSAAGTRYATNQYQIYSDGGESLLLAGNDAVTPLTIMGTAAQSGVLQRWRTSAAANLVAITAAGALAFGSTGDTNLYRSAADTLKTDDALVVALSFSHLGTTLGFFNTSPVAQQTASTVSALWTALKAYGLLDSGSTSPGTFVTSVTAGDTSIVIGGTAAAPTVATNTLDVIATNHPPAADWSNNSMKITSVKDPTNAQDAATKTYVDNTVSSAAASVILLPTTDARNVIQPSAATVKLLTLKGYASQSDSLLEFQDSTGTVLGTVNPAGDYAIGSNLTISASGYADLAEISAPSTPSSNHARIYVEDDGNGLTQIVAKFQSGNTVVIAKDYS